MPRRTPTRIAWFILGAVLLAGCIITLVSRYVPAPDTSWMRFLRDLNVLLDVAAFLLWMIVLALIATRRRPR